MPNRLAFRDFVRAPVDVLIVGGGITGAGVLLAAAQAGLRVALIEQRDFAWGSSSRSSKLVHGGMRYLKYGKVALTALALRERDRLLHDYPDLTRELRFYLPYREQAPLALRAGLRLYDGLAKNHTRANYDAAMLRQTFPFMRNEYAGALSYIDGQTDDAQLVLRVLQQARQLGAVACNYVSAMQALMSSNGISGAAVADALSGEQYEIKARVVVNAAGAWATQWLRHNAPRSLRKLKIKPLRGSHLVLPFHRLPLTQAMAIMHPVDERPMFALPWGGEVIFGTTDVEHVDDLHNEPRISATEFDYLMDALRRQFPSLNLDSNDVISTYAGVRPTIDDGHFNATEISREHCIAEQTGLITIAGGKLTTFRHMAAQIIKRVVKQLHQPTTAAQKIINPSNAPFNNHRDPLAGLQQDVIHLDDWMLRRTHFGLMSENGGIEHLSKFRHAICQRLQWDEARWHTELTRYQQIYQSAYAKPG